ncbi:hypothetical protein [Nocardia aurantiaca]|uniref:Uncharacterized protein n=1 Tax=Nocardia aurantiaca TaxID=2675850 RepID=A0A6I3L7W3_9NOCA|nr:hypothetical protein [Nocardia aurantiaca]MTE17498.1 hypothetical protein [Nocardia aurantiaca]
MASEPGCIEVGRVGSVGRVDDGDMVVGDRGEMTEIGPDPSSSRTSLLLALRPKPEQRGVANIVEIGLGRLPFAACGHLGGIPDDTRLR